MKIIAFTAAAPAPILATSSMKRLVWLLVAVLCTALVPVQPAEQSAAKTCCCKHCKCKEGCRGSAGACPMAPAPVLFTSDRSVEPASVTAVRRARPGRGERAKFFVSFVGRRVVKARLVATFEAARAAPAPLFEAHCSFLI
jgi:hypothetical protein